MSSQCHRLTRNHERRCDFEKIANCYADRDLIVATVVFGYANENRRYFVPTKFSRHANLLSLVRGHCAVTDSQRHLVFGFEFDFEFCFAFL